MIDLHTHTILSDGVLVPSEIVRRAVVSGYTAIALTDHVDHSNIDLVLPGLVRVSNILNRYWDITVIPGVEITHVPLEVFPELVSYARKKGAKIVVGHGESPVEPVLPGTNKAAIMAGVDILAHPGHIDRDTASLAAEKEVYLEITTRNGHSQTNKHVLDTALLSGSRLVLNTDSHAPDDLLTREKIRTLLWNIGAPEGFADIVARNSEELVRRGVKRR